MSELSKTQRLYSILEAAQQLGVGRHTIYSLIRNGSLKAVKMPSIHLRDGKLSRRRTPMRVRHEDLQEFIQLLADVEMETYAPSA